MRNKRRTSATLRALAFLLLTSLANALAQTPADPSFEVVSVKPWTFLPGAGTGFRVEPGRAYCTQCILTLLIYEAYGVGADHMVGPKWLFDFQGGPTFYQLDARFPPTTAADLVPAMMRRMLAERFHLIAHVESRDTAVYALRVAPGGLKIKPTPPPEDPSNPPPQQILGGLDSRTGVVNLHGSMTLELLARSLDTDREVVDETGTSGKFEVFLKARLPALPTMHVTLPIPIPPLNPDDPTVLTVPSVFSEIQKLGLRLEPTHVPLDYLVIERMDPIPTPN